MLEAEIQGGVCGRQAAVFLHVEPEEQQWQVAWAVLGEPSAEIEQARPRQNLLEGGSGAATATATAVV